MEMLISFSPRMTPWAFARAAFAIPLRTASTYCSGDLPNILYSSRISIAASLLLMRRTPVLLQPMPVGLTDAVENDRDADDAKSVEDPLREILVGDGLKNVKAKPLHTDHRSDDNHAKRHHDRLIDAGHDRRHGKRHLYFPELLRARTAIGLGRLQDLLVDQANAEVREPDDRRDGVDHHGDEARHSADAEQHDDGYEIDERRHRLHDIKKRLHEAADTPVAVHQDAERYADGDGEDRRREDERDRLHRILPQTQETDRNQRSDDRQNHGPAARRKPCHGSQHKDHERPGSAQNRLFEEDQNALQRVEEILDRVAVDAGESPEGTVDEAFDGQQKVRVQLRKLEQPIHVAVPSEGSPPSPRALANSRKNGGEIKRPKNANPARGQEQR